MTGVINQLKPTKMSKAIEKAKPKLLPGVPVSQQILSNAQDSREVIRDFVPLAESLEWELGQQYLKERGNKAFISDASPVPFVINNDGSLSRNAAEVFFTSLVEAENACDLEPEIFVLELGIGVGLFARFFLDNLRDLCKKHKKDYYDRLTYIAADRSERMLRDVLKHGVLANHPGRYRVRLCDAMKPDEALSRDVMFEASRKGAEAQRDGRPFRAVFLNYLLDCLPAAALEFTAEGVRQLCCRTLVARSVRLEDYTDMTAEQLRERAVSDDLVAKQELLEVYGLFASEYDYRPVEPSSLPYASYLEQKRDGKTKRFLHSYGALQSLEKLSGLVHESGFILVNDYGQTQPTRDEEFEHQRFSLATFVGLNFPQLQEYFGESHHLPWIDPNTDDKEQGIHTRLFCRRPAPALLERYRAIFGKAAHDQLNEPIERARQCLKVGRFELAAENYFKAISQQPGNWVLLNEASSFLTFQFGDPKAGVDLAKVALGLNPSCSAELWNTLGDGLYAWGRLAESRSAYHKALAINATDVRARFNLSWVHIQEKDYPAALERIAEALALDKTGEYRDRLLQKQQEALAHLTRRHQQEYLLLINLVSRYARRGEGSGVRGEETTSRGQESGVSGQEDDGKQTPESDSPITRDA